MSQPDSFVPLEIAMSLHRGAFKNEIVGLTRFYVTTPWPTVVEVVGRRKTTKAVGVAERLGFPQAQAGEFDPGNIPDSNLISVRGNQDSSCEF